MCSPALRLFAPLEDEEEGDEGAGEDEGLDDMLQTDCVDVDAVVVVVTTANAFTPRSHDKARRGVYYKGYGL